ncbi:hypothetical protein GIB67_010018 [Kingdonia uniflora]|uniref:Uncharacterized protein n=1 Tax=Kingdonia uniflora TaxID=39325 RepID=A0A7J7KV17_9MAGN|nr:hypothetical protein GIB67_010018 [Kingdonia uniflora]
MASSSPLLFFLFLLSLLSSFQFSCLSEKTSFKDIDLGNPVLHISPLPLSGYSSTGGSKDNVLCERVRVAGVSRWQIKSYANSIRITLTPSVAIPEKFHSKITVCFHGNASLGLCQCAADEWKTIQNGQWICNKSPYVDKYVDVKLMDGVSGSLTVSIEEDFQQWRIYFLALGFVLLLLAPVVSNCVPFYYGSSMTMGVLVVVLIILFQGMKLIPTGRRSVFYITIYGSLLGIGSFILNYVTMLVNSILLEFGLSDDMHNPVYILVVVGIVISGAALGYWFVRKFVISENGSVEKGIAQFVKWAMRIVAMTCIYQSTPDFPLAVAALASCWGIYSLTTFFKWRWIKSTYPSNPSSGKLWLQKNKHTSATHKRTEFLSRSPKTASGRASSSATKLYDSSPSPSKGFILRTQNKSATPEYYSSYHKLLNRKRSKRQWNELTEECTKQAMAEWAASPEVSNWIIENAQRIQLLPEENSDSSGDESDASEEAVVENGSGHGILSWYKG